MTAPRELDTGFKAVTCVAWSPDGKRLACASAGGDLALWDWPSQRKLALLKGHARRISCLSWNADNRRLASAGDDSEVWLWDTLVGNDLDRRLAPGGFVAWSPNGKRLLSSYGVRALALIDDFDEPPTRVLLHASQPLSAAWSPDGASLAAAESSGKVTLWDANSGTAIPPMLMSGDPQLPPCWCRKGSGIVVPAATKSVDLLDVKTGAIVRSLKNTQVAGMTLSSDQERAALATREGKLRVWNLANGQVESEFQVETASPLGSCWHPGGKTLAYCAPEGRVRFIEMRSYEL